MKDCKFQFEIIETSKEGFKNAQKKLNQWNTIGIYKSHRFTSISDTHMLLEVILKKA